jgi:hypothetical protein
MLYVDLLPVGPGLLIKLIIMSRMRKRTSAVVTRNSLHLGGFVSQIEKKEEKVGEKTC